MVRRLLTCFFSHPPLKYLLRGRDGGAGRIANLLFTGDGHSVQCSSFELKQYSSDDPQLEFKHVCRRLGVNVEGPEVVQAHSLLRLATREVVSRRGHDQVARLVVNGVGSQHHFLFLFFSKSMSKKETGDIR